MFNPFKDILVTQLSGRFLSHRSNTFHLQMLVPTFSVSHRVADLAPVVAMYSNVFPGSLSDVEQEFKLWQVKWKNGKIMANNAFDALEQCTVNYPNIKLLLQILATLPVTTASAERTFSMLRRLKTWPRSTMTEDRLNGLALLASSVDVNRLLVMYSTGSSAKIEESSSGICPEVNWTNRDPLSAPKLGEHTSWHGEKSMLKSSLWVTVHQPENSNSLSFCNFVHLLTNHHRSISLHQ